MNAFKYLFNWSSRSVIWSGFIIALSLLISGCGVKGGNGGNSNSSSGSSSLSSTRNSVGTPECYSCHADGMIDKYNEKNILSDWLNGPHGNYEGNYNADNGINNEGFPGYGYEGLGEEATCTTECHDPLDDGTNLEDYYVKTGSSFLGVVNRPIVGCESCHGSGDSHFGTGPIEYAMPDDDMCGVCHNDELDQTSNHVTYHPESDNITSDYQASPHSRSINSHNYESGSTTDVRATCSRCHTDEGARTYRDILGGSVATNTSPSMSTLIPGTNSPVKDASNVQCRTCHNAHDPGKLLLPANESASSEYRTCTNCHLNILDDDGHDNSYHGYNSSHSWSDKSVGSGTFDGGRTIMDTHFNDNASTPEIEGYNINVLNERVCRDCHNPHSADTTINEDWANSSHGGHIKETIDPSTGLAGVTEAEGVAWVHYDFKGEDRQACQRCHTSTGFKNLVTDPENYDPEDNDFSYLTGEQREMLYCWACHKDNTGNLRDDAVFTDIAPYSTPASRISAVPDLSGSNVCMSCHSGRVSGQEIKDKDLATEIQGMNFGGFNSHYLAAGGVLFRTIGYEFDGQNYDNVVYFTHDKIGTTDDTDMGSNGPCVGCHMKSPNGHTLENVIKDSGGDITDITAYDNVCSKCHSDKTTLITRLNELHDGYEAALDEIKTLLAAQTPPIYYKTNYPYFFNTLDPGGASTWFSAWPDKETIGAAFNLNMLLHIKGYAHNHEYTRKLIYDSIDFLDDGILNNSVEATLGGSGDAFNYLGGTR